jgi:hypothetical protein
MPQPTKPGNNASDLAVPAVISNMDDIGKNSISVALCDAWVV